MALLRAYPNTLFGRNRNEKEFFVAYISADEGTISSPTKVTMTVIDYTPNITHDSSNKEIDLPANSTFRITVQVTLTGASGYVDIYDETGTAIIMKSATAAGEHHLEAYVRTTTAIAISIRLDDITANTLAADDTLVMVERLAVVLV